MKYTAILYTVEAFAAIAAAKAAAIDAANNGSKAEAAAARAALRDAKAAAKAAHIEIEFDAADAAAAHAAAPTMEGFEITTIYPHIETTITAAARRVVRCVIRTVASRRADAHSLRMLSAMQARHEYDDCDTSDLMQTAAAALWAARCAGCDTLSAYDAAFTAVNAAIRAWKNADARRADAAAARDDAAAQDDALNVADAAAAAALESVGDAAARDDAAAHILHAAAKAMTEKQRRAVALCARGYSVRAAAKRMRISPTAYAKHLAAARKAARRAAEQRADCVQMLACYDAAAAAVYADAMQDAAHAVTIAAATAAQHANAACAEMPLRYFKRSRADDAQRAAAIIERYTADARRADAARDAEADAAIAAAVDAQRAADDARRAAYTLHVDARRDAAAIDAQRAADDAADAALEKRADARAYIRHCFAAAAHARALRIIDAADDAATLCAAAIVYDAARLDAAQRAAHRAANDTYQAFIDACNKARAVSDYDTVDKRKLPLIRKLHRIHK